MATILNIETSGSICSVALAQDGKLISEAISRSENAHASELTNLIKQVLTDVQITLQELNAIAVSAGPGSYTGLRIGASTAKGLCHGLGIPLIAVETLKAMVAGICNSHDRDLFYCPMIDARRMEVYTGVYDENRNELLSARPMIVDQNSFTALLEHHKIIFFGPGLPKCTPFLQHPHSFFNNTFTLTAKSMVFDSFSKHQHSDFVSVIYFEPAYLKMAFMTTPKPLL